MKLVCFAITATLCGILSAHEVLLVHVEKPYVIISQEKESTLEHMDRICIYRDKTDIACGDVTLSKPEYAIARIDFKHEEIKKYSEKTKDEQWVELEFQRPTPARGDKVRVENKEPKKQIRELTSQLVNTNHFGGEVISAERQDEIEIALQKIENSRPFNPVSVLGVGMNYVFPHIMYQQALRPNWGLGIMAMYVDNGINEGQGSLKGPGLFFTYNRYSSGPLNGFWWQISPGMLRMTARNGNKIETGVNQIAVLASLGWRVSWKDKMNFGCGLGGMYFPFGKNAGDTGLDFNGFIPVIVLDGGISF